MISQIKINSSFVISTILMVIAIFTIIVVNHRKIVHVIENRLDNFPKKIGQWEGYDVRMRDRVIEELDTDIFINRNYTFKNPNFMTISFYAGYYGTQKGGRTGHHPEACLPSQGWAIIENSIIKISIPERNNQKISINRLISKNNDKRKIVYHWYQAAGGKVFSNGFAQNINRLWMRILYNKNDGAYVQLILEDDGEKEIDEKLIKEFASQVYLKLISFWPEEK